MIEKIKKLDSEHKAHNHNEDAEQEELQDL